MKPFHTRGWGSGPNPHFFKSVEKRVFFWRFFLLFLTLFNCKISRNLHTFGGWGSRRCGKNPHFFFECFPKISPNSTSGECINCSHIIFLVRNTCNYEGRVLLRKMQMFWMFIFLLLMLLLHITITTSSLILACS